MNFEAFGILQNVFFLEVAIICYDFWEVFMYQASFLVSRRFQLLRLTISLIS